MTKIATKSYTKRQLAAKARRDAKQARMGVIAALAYATPEEVEFRINKRGYVMRATPAPAHEARGFVYGQRAIDVADVYEQLGEGFLPDWIKRNFIVPHGPSIRNDGDVRVWLITEVGAKHWNLPNTLPNGCPGAYAKIAA